MMPRRPMRPQALQPQVHRAMSLNTGVEATSLLQEMKQKQELRERRQKLKQELDTLAANTQQTDFGRVGALRMELASVEGFLETVDGALVSRPKAKADPLACSPDDPDASMLYVGSLAADWTEEMLWREFSRFGEVKHVNIIQPQTATPRSRCARVGSVRFGSRQQAELAMSKMSGQVYFGMAIYVYFAKPIAGQWVRKVPGARTLPECYNCGSMYHFAKECPHPPRDGLPLGLLGPPGLPALPGPGPAPNPLIGRPVGTLLGPAAAAGLPASGTGTALESSHVPPGSLPIAVAGAHLQLQVQAQAAAARRTQFDRAKVFNVELPLDFQVKSLIDQTAAVVAEEGWEFEKLLFDREQDNPKFSFLVNRSDNLEHPYHLYYRWRTFAFTQGDTALRWRTEPFRMYENGPVWKPPPCKGKDWVADEKLPKLPAPKRRDGKGRPVGTAGGAELSQEETIKLERLIAEDLSLDRSAILEAMAFCLDNAGASQAIAHTICSSISGAEPAVTGRQLTARLYLLSDVLFNSHCSRPGASMYRRMFQEYLPEVFEQLRHASEAMPPGDSQSFQEGIRRLLCTWSEWSTFPPQFLRGLEATLSRDSGNAEREDLDASTWEAAMAEGSRAHMEMERQCKLRGLAITGTPRRLAERLCHFEAYWKEMTAKVALAAAMTPSGDPVLITDADKGESLEAGHLSSQAEEAMPAPDPELDGESLSGSDAECQEDCGEGSQKQIGTTIPLLHDSDLEEGGEVSQTQSGSATTTIPLLRASDLEESGDASQKQAGSASGGDLLEDRRGAAAHEEPDSGAKEEMRRRERLRQVEAEVMRFQAALEAARVLPDVIAMKCDKKRMELLESAAQEEAVLDMRVRAAPASTAAAPAPAAAQGKSAPSREAAAPSNTRQEQRAATSSSTSASSSAGASASASSSSAPRASPEQRKGYEEDREKDKERRQGQGQASVQKRQLEQERRSEEEKRRREEKEKEKEGGERERERERVKEKEKEKEKERKEERREEKEKRRAEDERRRGEDDKRRGEAGRSDRDRRRAEEERKRAGQKSREGGHSKGGRSGHEKDKDKDKPS